MNDDFLKLVRPTVDSIFPVENVTGTALDVAVPAGETLPVSTPVGAPLQVSAPSTSPVATVTNQKKVISMVAGSVSYGTNTLNTPIPAGAKWAYVSADNTGGDTSETCVWSIGDGASNMQIVGVTDMPPGGSAGIHNLDWSSAKMIEIPDLSVITASPVLRSFYRTNSGGSGGAFAIAITFMG